MLLICWFHQSYYRCNQAKVLIHLENEKTVRNSANYKRKSYLQICRKRKYVKILQTEKDDLTGQVTKILFDQTLIQIIDLDKDDLLILENYDVTCYKRIIVKCIIKCNESNCPYQPKKNLLSNFNCLILCTLENGTLQWGL